MPRPTGSRGRRSSPSADRGCAPAPSRPGWAVTCRPCASESSASTPKARPGLGDRPGAGRKPRLTGVERGCVIALARSAPPGRPVRDGAGDLVADDESGPAQWTLDSLTAAARAQGIVIARSQVRRILLKEKVRWRHTRSWTESTDPQFTPPRSPETSDESSSTCFKERRTSRVGPAYSRASERSRRAPASTSAGRLWRHVVGNEFLRGSPTGACSPQYRIMVKRSR